MHAVLFYDVVVAVHVMAIVLAFGVTFAYPVMGPFIGRNHPGSLVALHELQERLGKVLISPFAGLALITGIYLAADRDYFDKIWVQVPMAILLITLVVGGGVMGPAAAKAAALAPRDGPPSAEYLTVVDRAKKIGMLLGVLVLVAIYFMVVKPGGY